MTSQNSEIQSHINHRDAGLHRDIGALGLGFTIVSEVIGAGIFSLPATIFLYAGNLSLAAYLVCAFAFGAITMCFAECASRVATAGGAYGYISEAFGDFWALVIGVLLWLGAALAYGGIAAAFTDGIIGFFPVLNFPNSRNYIILAVGLLFVLINLRGAKESAGFVSIATFLKIMPLVVFVLVGVWAIFFGGYKAQFTAPQGSEFGRAVLLALFAFSGMETPLAVSGEVKNPNKTIPFALFWGMGLVLILYIGIQFAAQGLLGNALASSTTPLADAMKVVSPSLFWLLLFGATFSRLIWLSADTLAAPRILFALGRDSLLPKIFGKLNEKRGVPSFSIIFHVTIGTLLAISGTFEKLVVLSALASAGIYLLVCLAAIVLVNRKIATKGEPLGFKFILPSALVGIVFTVAAIALAKRDEIYGLLAVVAACFVYFQLRNFLAKRFN